MKLLDGLLFLVQSNQHVASEERRGVEGGAAPNPLLATNIFRKFTYTKSNFEELPPTDIFHKFTYTKFNFEGVAPNKYFP